MADDIDRQVAERVAERQFFDRAQAVAETGARTIPNFDQAVRLVEAVGFGDRGPLEDVFAASSAPERLLAELAKDPGKAAGIARMSPRERVAELTRLDAASRAPRQVAPPPAPAKVNWRSDAASDEEFTAGFRQMMVDRRGLR